MENTESSTQEIREFYILLLKFGREQARKLDLACNFLEQQIVDESAALILRILLLSDISSQQTFQQNSTTYSLNPQVKITKDWL